jgi:hypothetical protein
MMGGQSDLYRKMKVLIIVLNVFLLALVTFDRVGWKCVRRLEPLRTVPGVRASVCDVLGPAMDVIRRCASAANVDTF